MDQGKALKLSDVPQSCFNAPFTPAHFPELDPDPKPPETMVNRGGALSSHAARAFFTVPVEGARRVADRFTLGGDKYGHNNWKNGDWTFVLERLAHMEEHLLLLKENGNVDDDNLGAILWGGYCLAWYEANKPEEWKTAMSAIQGRTKFNVVAK